MGENQLPYYVQYNDNVGIIEVTTFKNFSGLGWKTWYLLILFSIISLTIRLNYNGSI
jgi:hypothetical protein